MKLTIRCVLSVVVAGVSVIPAVAAESPSTPPAATSNPTTQSVVSEFDRLLQRAAVEVPWYSFLDATQAARSGRTVPIGDVPDYVRKDAVGWFRKIVGPSYTPSDEVLQGAWTAVADATVKANRDPAGKIVHRWTGDYLALEYELPDAKIQLTESGDEFCFVVTPRDSKTMGKGADAEELCRAWAKRLLNIPDNAGDYTGKFTSTPEGCFVLLKSATFRPWPRTPEEEAKGDIRNWWDMIGLATDGSKVVIVVSEWGGPMVRRGRMNMPNRF